MEKTELFKKLSDAAVGLGAFRASVIEVSGVTTDVSFRTLCEKNVCGSYGKNWMCPPDAGEINELIGVLRSFRYILVYQTVGELEDSYDFEGMMAAAEKHHGLMSSVREATEKEGLPRTLYLGAGGCRLCEKCAKITNEPCRNPGKAMPSLEAYGVNVSELARAAGMKYINGVNTVTYFGAVLFDL
ncbi:MAG: DUF2284 domain-containing protein [Clostridia bacterium]|nr:DUF2284 domain-containing protein [Clostridia bacterium]